jgi:hypothetical protein
MTTPNLDDRQRLLEQIVAEAFKDKSLKEALEAYEIGQAEYMRAISSSVVIQVSSGNTSNPDNSKGYNIANVDRN